MRTTRFLTVLALAGAAACGGGSGTDAAKADSLQRDLAMAPADTTAAMNDQPAATPPAATPAATTPAPATKPATRPAPTPSRLAMGTTFAAEAVDSITSRRNHAGETMRVRVSADVKDPQGRTVIPAGAVVALRIDTLAPAENDADHTGKLHLTPTSVEIGGTSYPLSASVDSVKYSIVGRGVTAGDAAKVGAGAAAGAVAGRLLGGKRGTAVGAVVGAAGGAAVASQTNDRDVVIRPGNYGRIKLAGVFARS
ncbi:MAG TPA: glycine zipper 2TM domain-containing protein [Gemmatimonadales bacterium]|nr:glycine zipper 2TM domain-containing protein [Gemmatimonadales bacterium]